MCRGSFVLDFSLVYRLGAHAIVPVPEERVHAALCGGELVVVEVEEQGGRYPATAQCLFAVATGGLSNE